MSTLLKVSRLSAYNRDPDPFLYLLAEFVSSLLAHGKGAAFFVLPDTGMLGPFETQTVDVTAYTDMWGEYRDHLICKVWRCTDTSGLQITFYRRISFFTHLFTSSCCWWCWHVVFLLGGGPWGRAHSSADDGERLPTLLPNDRPASRWPEPGTDRTVCSTVHFSN